MRMPYVLTHLESFESLRDMWNDPRIVDYSDADMKKMYRKMKYKGYPKFSQTPPKNQVSQGDVKFTNNTFDSQQE